MEVCPQGAQGSGSHYPGNKRSNPELQQAEWLVMQHVGLQPFLTSIYSSISLGLSIQESSE